MTPVLYMVIPCYNEDTVLPITVPMFLDKIEELVETEKISPDSKILLVDDGSKDKTWEVICRFAHDYNEIKGLKLSKNFGHQKALLAGLNEATDKCDACISLDCDGQDDLNAVDKMLEQYLLGSDIVYGVRNNRGSDTAFKRTTAKGFYKFLSFLGAKVVYNHADFRLLSNRVLKELEDFGEYNIYLRGMIPLVGFRSTCVTYERRKRVEGTAKYSLKDMISLAFDGITSLTVKPIHLITALGLLISLISFIGIVWCVVTVLLGNAVAGWGSTVSIICFLGGIQLLSIGVIGEYVAKIYLETKKRPRYIVDKRTEDEK